ncbi:hypothetical protein OJF2_66030 [Aquisphaera giovannonii]|uniref:Anaphase-promoting complex subunit 4-like WD40 domain-containing protein n=1 Tax=Aquisphaera giovannonii TaxID=406548 RepID=A0A5B9WBW6_9BACT|nr:hypothetical protein [Aquisphaera giovannonii]QEH38007.1 hypothetical protein OJF2_66030 [Aquisphaera giovannonii]
MRKAPRIALALGGLACLAALAGSQRLGRPDRRAAYVVRFSPAGDRVAAITADVESRQGRLQVWDATTGRPSLSVATGDLLLSLAFAPDGRAVAVGGWGGAVELRDAADGRVLRSFAGHSTRCAGWPSCPTVGGSRPGPPTAGYSSRT